MGARKKKTVLESPQSPTSPTAAAFLQQNGGRPKSDCHHGKDRELPYHWLRDREDPAVKEYLHEENAYATRMMRRMTHNFEAHLLEEMESRELEGGAYMPDRDEHYYYYERSDNSSSDSDHNATSTEEEEEGDENPKKNKASKRDKMKQDKKKKKKKTSKRMAAKVKRIPAIDWASLKNSNGGGNDGWDAISDSSDSSASWASSHDGDAEDSDSDDPNDEDLTPCYRCPVVPGQDFALDCAKRFAQNPTAKFPKPPGEESVIDCRFLKAMEGLDKLSCGAYSTSPNHKLVVASLDTTEGTEKYGVRVYPVGSHRMLRQIGHTNCASEVEWASDSIFLYFTQDATGRPNKMYAHDLRRFSDVSVTTAVSSSPTGGVCVGSSETLSNKQKAKEKKKQQLLKKQQRQQLQRQQGAKGTSVSKEQAKQLALQDELVALGIIGNDSTQGPADSLLFEEGDAQFEIVNLMQTLSEDFILVDTECNLTTEILLLPVGQTVMDEYLKHPAARGAFGNSSSPCRMCVFSPRTKGWVYEVSHHKALPLQNLIQASAPVGVLEETSGTGSESTGGGRECWLVLHNGGGVHPNKMASYYCPPDCYVNQKLPPPSTPLCPDHSDWHQLVDFTIEHEEECEGESRNPHAFWILEDIDTAHDYILFTARRGDLLCSTVFLLDLTDPVIQQHTLPIPWTALLDVAPLVAPLGLGLPTGQVATAPPSSPYTPPATNLASSPMCPADSTTASFTASFSMLGVNIRGRAPYYRSPHITLGVDAPCIPTREIRLDRKQLPQQSKQQGKQGQDPSTISQQPPELPPQTKRWTPRLLLMDRTNGYKMHQYATELVQVPVPWLNQDDSVERKVDPATCGAATVGVNPYTQFCLTSNNSRRGGSGSSKQWKKKDLQNGESGGSSDLQQDTFAEGTGSGSALPSHPLYIPVLLTYKKDLFVRGTNPLFLHAYGSYGDYHDGQYDESYLSLLDRGVVVAYAGIRGGGEFGELWRRSGNMMYRKNTFRDFVACAEYLGNPNKTSANADGEIADMIPWCDKNKIVARGASAGGSVMGAVLNSRPDLFAGIIAAVPFTDVMTMMLDKTQPLTTQEWDEWGNPAQSAELYDYMLSYSPADNALASVPLTEREAEIAERKNRRMRGANKVDSFPTQTSRDTPENTSATHVTLPHVLVQSGWGDARVPYYDPATWVAKLRERWATIGGATTHPHHGNSGAKTQGTDHQQHESSFLLHNCDMHAGHQGGDGDVDTALEFAFALYCFGGAAALTKKCRPILKKSATGKKKI